MMASSVPPQLLLLVPPLSHTERHQCSAPIIAITDTAHLVPPGLTPSCSVQEHLTSQGPSVYPSNLQHHTVSSKPLVPVGTGALKLGLCRQYDVRLCVLEDGFSVP